MDEAIEESATEHDDLSEQDSYDPAEDSFDYALDALDDDVSEAELQEYAEIEEASLDEVALETTETLAEAKASALAHVQRLGRAHSTFLVHAICDIHSKCTGEEPSLSALVSTFADIRQSFADEALEQSSEEESESEEVSNTESTDVAV